MLLSININTALTSHLLIHDYCCIFLLSLEPLDFGGTGRFSELTLRGVEI